MKLKKVDIRNFRSIKETTVNFDDRCRVLVGINESGKSNVLKALSLIGETEPNTTEDVREPSRRESQIKEAYVRFVFSLSADEISELNEEASSLIGASVSNPQIVFNSKTEKNIKLHSFGKTKSEGLYNVNILEGEKKANYWAVSGYRLISGWQKVAASCPTDFKITINGEETSLKEFVLVRKADIENEVPEGYLEKPKISDLNKVYGNQIIELITNNLPEVILWDYDEENLLPSEVDIAAFSADPKTCIPLMNMFVLADCPDILKKLTDSQKGSTNRFQNFLDNIAEKTTEHFRETWPEYKDIEFELRLSANKIIPAVLEGNRFDFAQRSDGFKRFVTFLLIISVEVQNNNINDTLILIDEPEIGLHPKGVRYLRDELIRISKKNEVVFSTHSIFMIDTVNINRHYIVTKKNQITTINTATESNIVDEEVLLNALGFSIFEFLKEKNLIIEGWYDKELFNTYLATQPASVRNKFNNIGICHAKGASSIGTITPMLELAKRECVIVSDGDDTAIRQQKKYKDMKGFGSWYTYSDIDSELEEKTGEDFIENSHIVSCANKIFDAKNIPNISETDITQATDKLQSLDAWISANGTTDTKDKKEIIDEIKSEIFDALTFGDIISTSYKKLFDGVITKLEG